MVMIDGVLKKWGREIIGFKLADVRRIVEESRDYVLGAAGYEQNVLEQKYGLTSSPGHRH
jgi:hypothetical protein